MGKLKKNLRSLIAVALVTTTVFFGSSSLTQTTYAATTGTVTNAVTEPSTSNTYGLAGKVQDGAILHAWNWSFDTVKNNLKNIADAGYTTVQVSPIQGTKENSMETSKWWLLYQPTNFSIGNAQLGSREQFKTLCSEADKYGIKIVVDVIFNHTANRGGGSDQFWPDSHVDPELRDDPNCWHEHRGVNDWNNRWEVTHLGINLPDLNTANYKVQDKIIAFLNDCVDCGADGFRIDTAKHVELPSDPGGSDFWPRVLSSVKNRSNLFIYGEVLQGGADSFYNYQQYINLTASNYGGTIRNAVGFSGTKGVGYVNNYSSSGVNADHLVTWVESHDTYAGDEAISTNMNSWQIKMGWALITARAYSTPLYFNRPDGSGKFPGYMGSVGNGNWKDADVIAVNKFRNAMAGEGEYLRQQSNDVMMIERGTKGAVIVNLGGSTTLSSQTNLASGTYTNRATTGGTFTVSGGRITGNLPAGITVLYNTIPPAPEVSISPKEGGDFVGSLQLTLGAKSATSATYSINNGTAVSYTDGQVITIGQSTNDGDTVTVTLNATNGTTPVTKSYTYKKVPFINSSKVYFNNTNNWSNPTAYIYNDSVTPTKVVQAWPGVKLINEGNNIYSYELPSGFGDAKVVFSNNGSNQIPAQQQPGLSLPSGSKMIYTNGSWTIYNPIPPTPEVSSSKESGSFVDSLQLTLSAKNATSATYSINNGTKTTYTDGQVITIGQAANIGDTITVTLEATNGTTPVTKTYTYTKEDIVTSSKVYFKNTNNWSNPTAYIYNDSVTPTKVVQAWPGVKLINEGNNIYSYELPAGFGDAKVIFSDNGSNQIPAQQQPGLSLPTGSEMIYNNGSWTDYTGITDITKVYFRNTNNWSNPTIYVYNDSTKVTAWPGIKMTSEGNNLYSYTLPEGFGDAKIIFSDNGSNQIPGQQQPGLSISSGTKMIYDNGNWTSYNGVNAVLATPIVAEDSIVPEASVPVEESTQPEASAPVEENAQPETSASVEESTQPETSTPAEESTQPDSTSSIDENTQTETPASI